MHVIPVRIHSVLDYVVGALLIISPWLIGFANNGPAQWVPVAVGAAVIVYSLLTSYNLGATNVIPLPVHLALDVIAGIFLTMSPWLFGFQNIVIGPHVFFGVLAIVVATLTPSSRDYLSADVVRN
jgi:hypothetical protein